MRKRKKLVQKTLNLAAIASMGTAFAIASPSLASANQLNTSGERGVLAAENTSNSINKNAVGIIDVQTSLNTIGTAYYNTFIAGTKTGSSPTLTFKNSPDSVETKVNFNITGIANDLNFDSTVVEYVGENVFENKTDQTQKFSTSKYTKTVTESTATSTTKGFKVGGDGSNLFSIPLILNNGLKINAEFNSSTTETKTKTETKSIEASVQTIEVPPHKKYKVDVVLEQRNFWGDVTFTGEGVNPQTTIKGTASYWGPNGMGIWEQHTWSKNTALFHRELTNYPLNGIVFDFKNGVYNVKATGTGRVQGIFGSKLVVNVYDITNPSKTELVETRNYY